MKFGQLVILQKEMFFKKLYKNMTWQLVSDSFVFIQNQMQPLLDYYLVSRAFACLCFCTAQQKPGCIVQEQKLIKCCGTNFVCPFTANKLGSCISSLVLAGIHLNTESVKEWSEELFNGVSVFIKLQHGENVYMKRNRKVGC